MTVESEFHRVLGILAATGVNYPPGYEEEVISKYKQAGVRYPRILQRMGDPNIRKHAHYQEILQMQNNLLDYGCGTADDIRALVADGYPAEKIVGYDVNWDCINLGFDLYLDRETLGIQFVVDSGFPFQLSSFDIIYSGSVLHVLITKRAIRQYISNVFATLNAGGIFFGSTLGFGKDIQKRDKDEQMPREWQHRRRRRWRWLRWLARRVTFLTEDGLQKLLSEMGFTDTEILLDDTFRRLWFFARKPL